MLGKQPQAWKRHHIGGNCYRNQLRQIYKIGNFRSKSGLLPCVCALPLSQKNSSTGDQNIKKMGWHLQYRMDFNKTEYYFCIFSVVKNKQQKLLV